MGLFDLETFMAWRNQLTGEQDDCLVRHESALSEKYGCVRDGVNRAINQERQKIRGILRRKKQHRGTMNYDNRLKASADGKPQNGELQAASL